MAAFFIVPGLTQANLGYIALVKKLHVDKFLPPGRNCG